MMKMKAKTMITRLSIFCLSLALLLTVVSGCKEEKAHASENVNAPVSKPSTRPVIEQPTFILKAELFRKYIPAVGNLRASRLTQLGPEVSGRVEEVLVDVGDTIKKGQPLVRIKPTFFEISLAQAEASLLEAKAAVEEAEVDIDDAEREKQRQEELKKKNAGSPKEFNDSLEEYGRAIANHHKAQAQQKFAEKRVEYAREELEETTVRAPYDSVVTVRMVDPGEPVASNPVTHLMEIQDVGTLYLEYSLPQRYLGTVKPGTPIEFEIEGVTDGVLKGSVAIIYPAIDEATRSFRCRSIIPNPESDLLPGLLATVRVVESEIPNALFVPRECLTLRDDSWWVNVMENGIPTPRSVKIGTRGERTVVITEGIKAGEKIVLPR